MKCPRQRAYLGLALLAAGLVGLAASGDLIAHGTRLVTFYGLAGLGFGLLATAATSLPLRAALVAAILLRLAFLPGTPSLSDDVYRYVWDGRVQLAGVNPYRYAPADPALDHVEYAGRDGINHPRLRTVYPPLAQTLFLGVAAAERTAVAERGRVASAAPAAAGAACPSSSCSAPSTWPPRRRSGGSQAPDGTPPPCSTCSARR